MDRDKTAQIYRKQLYTWYKYALDAVQGHRIVASYLSAHPVNAPVYLLAIGKAAVSMTQGALSVLPRVAAGLVVTKYGHLLELAPGIECYQAGHPLPDQNSLLAGQRVVDFVQSVPRPGILLALISGGSSALVEHLPDALTLVDLQRVNQWLLASGLEIQAVNAVRRRLSCIKGGRLASYFSGQQVLGLLISDVPDDEPALIGSGLFSADPVATDIDVSKLPGWLQEFLYTVPPVINHQITGVSPITLHIVANLEMALIAAESAVQQLDLRVKRHQTRLQGDVTTAARVISAALRDSSDGVHLWGGELSVVLPDHPGRGGRCQSLALSVAEELAGQGGWCLLAAGTDGSDGPGTDAGAMVDGQTISRARQVLGASLQVDDYLRRADAGTVLAAAGDLLTTGPTGTNVTDLVFAVRFSDDA